MTDSYDAIVIGSGLGGLTAAASLAGRGKRVLVLERLKNFGGAATVYRHGSLTMEASLHETDGDTLQGPGGPFARLGLVGALKLLPTEDFYEVRGGVLARPIRVPHGLARARAALTEALPGSAKVLTGYFDALEQLHEALRGLADFGTRGPLALVGMLFSGRLFELIGDARHTVIERFDRHFGRDEAAKFALGALVNYFDDDPAKLSFLLYAGIWARYVDSGSYYFKGGSHALTMALVKQVTAAGGTARHGCEVSDILLDAAGRACGVRFQAGDGAVQEALAPVIFGGAAPAALAAMLPEPVRTPFQAHYAGFESSVSLFTVSLGIDRPAADFGVAAYSTVIYPDDMTRFADIAQAATVFGAEPEGRLPPYGLADCGRLQTGLRQKGDPYLVTLTGIDRLAWWEGLDEAGEQARRQRWIAALIADADRHFPGLAGAVTQAEIATSRTMQTRLGTPQGEVYGFRPTPGRLFRHIPSAATAVEGLWLASAYTISGGYAGAMQGGLMAADAAMRKRW